MNTRPPQPDRGLALVAVLVVMGSAMLVATSLLFLARAEIASSARALDQVQSRALAWSGVQVAISRLNEQRDVILQGRTPRLDDEFVIYETPSRLAVARLLPIGPDGERLVPEAGKLDLGSVEVEMLAATGIVDEALAQAVIDYRDRLGRPFQSVGELLHVGGLSPEVLYGPIDELALMDDAATAPRGPQRAGAPSGALRGLSDVVTVFGFEPALQQDGRLRINLNVQWSQELGERVAQRFDTDARHET